MFNERSKDGAGGGGGGCTELNGGPRGNVRVLIPGSHGCDLIWKRSFYRCN